MDTDPSRRAMTSIKFSLFRIVTWMAANSTIAALLAGAQGPKFDNYDPSGDANPVLAPRYHSDHWARVAESAFTS